LVNFALNFPESGGRLKMAIELVLYKQGNISEEVTLEEIENRSDFDTVKKKLFCAYDGCNARIEYVPRGKRIAHFKTWPMSDHSSDCIDFFEREKQKIGRRNLATSSVGLTDKHINNVLKSLINNVDETEEERELRLQRQRARNNRKNKTTDGSKNPEWGQNIKPTTDRDTETIEEGKRAPNVKKRHSISSLSEDDLGTATALHENIFSISIQENRVIFVLKKNEKETKVYFEESFFVNSVRNIDRMFDIVKGSLEEGNYLKLYCVGNVERRDGEICLIINSQNHFRINKMSIERFVFTTINPNLM
jgi:hypothetical protein